MKGVRQQKTASTAVFQVEVHLVALTGLQLTGLSSLPRMIQWLLDYLGFIPQQSRDEIIRLRHTAGETLSDLARTFGISPQRIYQIVSVDP